MPLQRNRAPEVAYREIHASRDLRPGRRARARPPGPLRPLRRASTRRPAATARRARRRRASSSSGACSSRSCARSASRTPAQDDNGYVIATLPGNVDGAPVDRPHRPSGHEPGRAGRRRRADRAPRLRRRPDRAAQGGTVLDPAELRELRGQRRPRHRHVQRRHAARRRRQGGRRRDRHRRGAPRRAPRAAAADAPGRLHARRGDRRGRLALRHRGLRRRVRLHAGRLDARRAAGRDVHRRRGDDPHRRASTSIPASPPASSSTPARLAGAHPRGAAGRTG